MGAGAPVVGETAEGARGTNGMDDTDYTSLDTLSPPAPEASDAPPRRVEAADDATIDAAALLAECEALAG